MRRFGWIVGIALLSGCVESSTDSATDPLGPAFDTLPGSTCDVRANGVLETGETVTVRASYGPTGPAGSEGTFRISDPGGDRIVGTVDLLLCFVNGAVLANMRGPAVFNGVPNHTFILDLQERPFENFMSIGVWSSDGTLVYLLPVIPLEHGRMVINADA